MGIHAFNMGCNVLAFEKNLKKYAMVCAWATMVGYEEIGMLVGSQSQTGKIIKIGDIVGVSGLAQGQKEIALKLGENHSADQTKFNDVDFVKEDSALLVKNSKTQMVCEVIKIMKVVDPDDNFIIMKIKRSTSNKNLNFLSLDNVYPEE